MSADRSSIAEALTSILRDLSAPETVRQTEDQGWNEQLWSVLADSGFTTISTPEEAGGSGGDIADACVVLTVVGRFAAAVPVAETSLLAGWALASSGREVPTGPATVAVGHAGDSIRLRDSGGSWRLSARLHRVPWARQAKTLVLLGSSEGVDHVVSVRPRDAEVLAGRNLAGESRDTVVIDDVTLSPEQVAVAPAGVDAAALRLRGALARAAAAAGALQRVSDLTVRYTNEREQFGRPLARFQAVQRHLVRIAEQAKLAGMAVEAAATNADREPDFFDVAAAKIVAAEASTTATAAAHQAHGAIGMTKEYELGQLTRRLWAWRDEFGGESAWSEALGHRLVAAGGAALWPRLSTGCVRLPDAVSTSA